MLNSQEELQKKKNGKLIAIVVSIIAFFVLITGGVSYYLFASMQTQKINNAESEQTVEVANKHQYFEETSVFGVAELIKNKDVVVIIGKKSCSHCETYKPKAKEFATAKKLKIYYIDLDSGSNRSDIQNYPNLSVEGTPTTLFFHNGEKVGELRGDVATERIEEALKKAEDNGFEIK